MPMRHCRLNAADYRKRLFFLLRQVAAATA
jgi:hypothetical protein